MRFTATGGRTVVATGVERRRDGATRLWRTRRSDDVDVSDATQEQVDEHVEGLLESLEVGRMGHERGAGRCAHVLFSRHVDLGDSCEERARPSRVDGQLGTAQHAR